MVEKKRIFTKEEIDKKVGSLKGEELRAYLNELLLDKDYSQYKKEFEKKIVPLIKEKPSATYNLTYDSFNEGLEPIYFWLLDFLRDTGPGGLGMEVTKTVEGYEASLSSGYQGEIGQKQAIMQQKAMEYLGAINQVVKSILNLVYDLKEFEIRIGIYDQYHSQDDREKDAGIRSLKGVWMDQVDVKNGRGSINSLSQELNFVTLRDAFFYVNDLKDIAKLDLNDRVKTLLKQKMTHFLEWVKFSEKEIRNRYAIEKAYLRSQVGSLRLYASWAKPYLKAANRLRMKEFNMPDIVNSFSNMQMELELMARTGEIKAEGIKEIYKTYKFKQKYYGVLLVNLRFRTVPQVVGSQQGRQYVHGGRVDFQFKGYGVTAVEYDALKNVELYEDMDLIDQWIGVSLEALQDELAKYLKEYEPKPKEEKFIEPPKFTNPFAGFMKGLNQIFSPLITLTGVKKEVYASKSVEKELFELSNKIAGERAKLAYDIYKKTHGMLAE